MIGCRQLSSASGKRSFISQISGLMQGQMDLHKKIIPWECLDWYRFAFKSMIFANNGSVIFYFEVAPSWIFLGNFSFGGGPFDLASTWKFPGFFHLVPESKYRFRAQKREYAQAGPKQRQRESYRWSIYKYIQSSNKYAWTKLLNKFWVDVDIFWTGPQVHEDPKENQLTIGWSTHRVIYTHVETSPGPGAGPGPHMCV